MSAEIGILLDNLAQVRASLADPSSARVACKPWSILTISQKTMSNLNKYLLLAILMTAINVPMYFYSKTLLKTPSSEGVVEHNAAADPHATHDEGHGASSDASGHGADPFKPIEKTDLQNELAAEEQPGRFQTLAKLYKPPLIGKCIKLFERYNRKNFPDKPYKAFVYSFDGEVAYCADAYTDKSQEAAEEIVIRDCEEHNAGSGKYSPCRIYSSE